MITPHLPAHPPLKILVIEDHEIFLGGTIEVLRRQYADAAIETAKTVQQAINAIKTGNPDLVLMDLSIPETTGAFARTEIGLQLLQTLMHDYPMLNLTILSSYIKALVKLRPEIENHGGGFTIADKNLPSQDVLSRVALSLQGITHTKDLRNGRSSLELKPEWLTVLNLAYREGLSDLAIAKRMNVSGRTVRLYFNKIQDVLDIYPEDCRRQGQNIRAQVGIRAREEGLLY